MTTADAKLLKLAAKVQAGARTILVQEQPYGIHTVYLDGRQVFREGVRVFAEDNCGNWIGQRGASPEVIFIDHESNATTVLANDIDDLAERLIEWKGPDLKPGQVVRVWVDPKFAKRLRRE